MLIPWGPGLFVVNEHRGVICLANAWDVWPQLRSRQHHLPYDSRKAGDFNLLSSVINRYNHYYNPSNPSPSSEMITPNIVTFVVQVVLLCSSMFSLMFEDNLGAGGSSLAPGVLLASSSSRRTAAFWEVRSSWHRCTESKHWATRFVVFLRLLSASLVILQRSSIENTQIMFWSRAVDMFQTWGTVPHIHIGRMNLSFHTADIEVQPQLFSRG